MTSDVHVLRLCSVFEPPDRALTGRAARFDPVGGMQNHTGHLVRALDARGVRQTVVTTRPPGAAARQRVGTAVVHRHGLPVPWFRQAYSVPARRTMHEQAARASLVHCHLGEDLAAAPIAVSAARRHRLPLVLTLHTSLAHTFDDRGARAWALRGLGGRIERWAVGQADAVIVLTARTRRLLTEAGAPADRVHVIPSGIVPAEFEGAAVAGDPLEGIGRPRVVFVGRLARQKGVRVLVEAAARLQTPGVQVVLVGDGPEREAVEELVARHGLQDRVRLHGFVPHDLVPAVLAGADLQVLPSIYEELGSALLEGMQAGAAIVATDTGGIPDAVGDAAELVPPGDPAALAAAIDALLADPARRAAMAQRARRRARRYDWDDLADRVLGVYERALAPRSPASGSPEVAVLPSAVA